MNRLWLVSALALAGLAASPTTASAHFFRWWCAPNGGYGYGRWAVPQYQPYFVPQYYFVPVPVPVAPPSVTPVPMVPPKAKAEAPIQPSRAPMVTVTPQMPPPPPLSDDPLVKPTGGVASPMPAPAPMNPLTIPDPMVPVKPMKEPEPKPMKDADPSAKPPVVLPPIVLPDAPAKPMAAPSGPDPLPAIPLPEPKKVPMGKSGKDDLPPIVLPPEGTGTSSGVIPSTSRSSPLTGAIKTQVFAASGGAVSGTLRKVGFFNHSDRDLDLVIEGKAVTLPKKSFLHAQLPVKFTWKAAGGDSVSTTVPETATGVDVLFNE